MKIQLRFSTAIFVIGFILASCISSPVERTTLASVSEREITEQLVFEFEGEFPESLEISPDGKHYAYIVESESGTFMIIDGEEQKRYDQILDYTVEFSQDSQHLAFEAQSGSKVFFIVDGNEGKHYDYVNYFSFSPDSQQFAYAAGDGDEFFAVVNNVEQKHYSCNVCIGPLVFSPDSQHIAYGTDNMVVVDDLEGNSYDRIFDWDMVFSPDSQHFAYGAEKAGKEFVVLDGVEQQGYDDISFLSFSPDSNRFAYQASDGEAALIVIDGEEQAQYDAVIFWPGFSPDSHHVAYWAQNDGEQFVVVDGKEGGKFNALDLESDELFGIEYLLVDTLPTFSPDSQRVAYVNLDFTGGQFLTTFVVDGEEVGTYDTYFFEGPSFSPDSQHLAYLLHFASNDLLVVDGEEWSSDYRIENLLFSPDSRHLAYIGHLDDMAFVVVNRHKGNYYDQIFGNMIIFDGPNQFHYFAKIENGLYLVREKIIS